MRKIVFITLMALIVVLAATNTWAIFYYAPSLAENSENYSNDKYKADQNVSVYFEYLPTGASISINKDAEFYPASLLKVPVAMTVAKKIEKGEWKWTNELVLMSTDKDDKFGTLYKEPANSTHTIEDIVRR